MLARIFLIVIALVFIVGVFDISLGPQPKFGFVDTTGRMVIEPQFDRVNGIGTGNLVYTVEPKKSFHEGLAGVAIGKQWGFVDKTGKVVIKPQYDEVGEFSEGLACVESHEKCGFIDHSGKLVIPMKFNPHALHCGFAVFKDGLCPAELADWQFGYIDKTGNWVVQPNLHCGWAFSEGRAVVSKAQGSAVIDTTGKTIFESKGKSVTTSFSDGLACVTDLYRDPSAKTFYIDRNGNQVTKELTTVSGKDSIFTEGLAAFRFASEKFGYIDKTGVTAIQPLFDNAGEFHEGLAAVGIAGPGEESQLHPKWGYIDKRGNWAIPAQFEHAGDFSDGLASVRINGKEGAIDKSGKLVIPAKYSHIFPFSEGLAAIR